MTRVPLTLGKHYLLIDSPISFFLVDNEENSVYRPSGVWQLDTWKLLPVKYQKDHPVYTLAVEYDDSKLTDGKEVLIRESDIDLGDGVAGVSGQSVMLTGINDSLLPIPVSVKNIPDVQKVSVQNNPTSIAVDNFPANQKVTVANIPDVQKVSVQNNPTSIAVSNFPDVVSNRSALFFASNFMQITTFSAFISFLKKNASSIRLVAIRTSLSASETHVLMNFNFPVFVEDTFISFCGYFRNFSAADDSFSDKFKLFSLDNAAFVSASVYYD
jgi:hypothetical protein